MPREDNWKYIYEIEARRHKLFDLSTDPAEQLNRAAKQAELTERFRRQLLDWSETQRGHILRQR
jgi:arylsulfatase A-like enzyme